MPAQTPLTAQTPPTARSPRRLFVIAILAAVAGLVLTLSFGYADHAPRPHGVRIAVSAPAAVGAELAAGLDHQSPGAFTFVSVTSPRAAARRVRNQSAAGAIVVPATGPTTIVTTGA